MIKKLLNKNNCKLKLQIFLRYYYIIHEYILKLFFILKEIFLFINYL